MSTAAKIEYVKWIADRDPFLFEIIRKAHELKTGQQLSGIFDFVSNIDWKGLATTAVETVKNVAPSLVQYKAQMAALKTNLQRAETGLPPIDYSQYTPVVKVEAQVTPEMEEAATRIAMRSVEQGASSLKTPLLFMALAVGAFMLTRRRGR